jgi:hypothetical protein
MFLPHMQAYSKIINTENKTNPKEKSIKNIKISLSKASLLITV